MADAHVVTVRGLTKIYRQGEINVTALNNIYEGLQVCTRPTNENDKAGATFGCR